MSIDPPLAIPEVHAVTAPPPVDAGATGLDTDPGAAVAGGAEPAPAPPAAGTSPAIGTREVQVAPPLALISPEAPGALVSLSDVSLDGAALSAELVTPAQPGLYRLAVSIHDGDGVAFDATTQERIPAFTVRVTGELSAVVSATDRLRVAAGAGLDLPVAVANTGHLAWVSNEVRSSDDGPRTMPVAGEWYSVLVGQWLRLDGPAGAPGAVAARATIQPLPGATEEVLLALTAPSDPGAYLLVLDVVSPLYGSLTAVGGAPVVVRVEVTSPDSTDAQDGNRSGQPDAPAVLTPG